ncbi:IQ domain-containing protein M [Liasis olivaceus]
MDCLSLSNIPEDPPRRTSTSAPPILGAGVDSQYRHSIQRAEANKITWEKMATWQFPGSTIHSKTRSDESQLLECGETKGNKYQDWRGIVLSENTVPYTMLSYEAHQARLKLITRRQRFKEKVKRIGPHLEIFEAFNKIRRIPTKEKIVSAATCIQKLIRGWFERTRLNRIKMKAKNHGPNLSAVIKDYRKMMYRIKRRCGILDTSTPLIFEQLEDWLDNKLLYETIFDKREDLKEMDRNELPKFFRDCGHFPTQKEINKTTKLVLQDSGSKNISINKTQVLDIAFMLYPPVGLKLATAAASRSTWVKPIVDGEDSYMYLVRGHPVLKAADIRVAGALVAASMRERKKKERTNNGSYFSEEND